MRCRRNLRELKKADALTLISQMETRPQHLRLVAGNQAGHYTVTGGVHLHGLYRLRQKFFYVTDRESIYIQSYDSKVPSGEQRPITYKQLYISLTAIGRL
jgi:hypothetical protein